MFGAPDSWDDSNGACLGLCVREMQSANGPIFESAWEPTPAELAALNAGGTVRLRVVGGQPPVLLFVEPTE
ncbi:MAG: hypothetical protein KGL39_41585 [Patescibacteria group bacterium]|nr:hypothetical protein [Patescibacteria group bacterium]